MSDAQTAWTILWNRALTTAGPFETSEVLPEVVARLKVDEQQAARLVSLLLTELSRLPEGRRFFRLEGQAIVPLQEFVDASRGTANPLSVYPYEL